MKRFLVLSAIVGVAGLGVGFAGRSGSPAPQVAAPVETTTTTAAVPVPAPAAPPVAPTAAATATKKAAAPKPTVTTQRPAAAPAPTTTTRPVVAAPTTTTTAAPVASTTTTTLAVVTPDCTVAAEKPAVHPGDQQTITVQTAPGTKGRLTVQYPKFGTGKPNPRFEYTFTADGAGTFVKTFAVQDTSTVPAAVNVSLYDSAGHLNSACASSFTST